MKVLQPLFMSLLLSIFGLLLFFPPATALRDDSLPVTTDWADVFSTLNCYCFGWERPAGPGPEHYRSGSYFGVSFYNRATDHMYNRTTIEVRNGLGRLLEDRNDWDYQPKLGLRCRKYGDDKQLCYWRYVHQVHGRYSFQDYSRVLPRVKHLKQYKLSTRGECHTICPEVVKLPHVSELMSMRFDYKMEPVCDGHDHGLCTKDLSPV